MPNSSLELRGCCSSVCAISCPCQARRAPAVATTQDTWHRRSLATQLLLPMPPRHYCCCSEMTRCEKP